MSFPVKALIADDDKPVALLMETLLSGWGCDVIKVLDGEQALHAMKSGEPPSLLLLDWEMPNLSGIELCQKIRAIKTDDPPYIILCTGHNGAQYISEGLNVGANDYIAKPILVDVLRAKVDVGRRALALQARLLRNLDNLNKLAYFDELTGCYNRRAVFERVEKGIARAERYRIATCLAVFDIDWFKAINDRFGHLGGDSVLKQLGELLPNLLRSYDLIGRIGGEEFVLFFQLQSKADAYGVLERVRARIAQHCFMFEGQRIPVTASFGGLFMPQPSPELALAQWFKIADEALYASKDNGRNCITVWES